MKSWLLAGQDETDWLIGAWGQRCPAPPVINTEVGGFMGAMSLYGGEAVKNCKVAPTIYAAIGH